MIAPYRTPTALRLQTSRQIPQRIHLSSSITWSVCSFPSMASTVQLRAQSVQPLQFSAMTKNVIRSLQMPAGHFLSLMCASYSSRK